MCTFGEFGLFIRKSLCHVFLFFVLSKKLLTQEEKEFREFIIFLLSILHRSNHSFYPSPSRSMRSTHVASAHVPTLDPVSTCNRLLMTLPSLLSMSMTIARWPSHSGIDLDVDRLVAYIVRSHVVVVV
jgi:hypothetical protein